MPPLCTFFPSTGAQSPIIAPLVGQSFQREPNQKMFKHQALILVGQLFQREPRAECQHEVQRTLLVDSLNIRSIVKMVTETGLDIDAKAPGQIGMDT